MVDTQMAQQTSTSQLLRRIFIMRVAFIILLCGNGIALFTSFALTFNEINLLVGGDQFQFFIQIHTFSVILSNVSMGLTFGGSIVLLLCLLRIDQK